MLRPRALLRLSEAVVFDLPCSHAPRYLHGVLAVCRAPLAASQTLVQCRSASSSSTRWKSRQGKDRFSKEAKVQGLKSRAAFKLLEMNEKYRFFKRGDTVVDLGYAPGSWSQVAIDRTQPGGRVIGIDIIPAQPPKGVSTIQGDFLSPAVQAEVRKYVQDPMRGRMREGVGLDPFEYGEDMRNGNGVQSELGGTKGYIETKARDPLETRAGDEASVTESTANNDDGAFEQPEHNKQLSKRERDEAAGRVVDVVLSDMSAPWDQTTGFGKNSISNPYLRMMNTSGMAFRDHAGSMDLCNAALAFCIDTLRTGGHFVCKFYQGSEDKLLEAQLRRLFERVHREKPESSRSESKEAFFVALRRKEGMGREDVFKT